MAVATGEKMTQEQLNLKELKESDMPDMVAITKDHHGCEQVVLSGTVSFCQEIDVGTPYIRADLAQERVERLEGAARDLLCLLTEPEYESASLRYFDRTNCDDSLIIEPLQATLKEGGGK